MSIFAWNGNERKPLVPVYGHKLIGKFIVDISRIIFGYDVDVVSWITSEILGQG